MKPAKQRQISEEGRARISASRVGKKWSQEVKDKISASKKGTICSAEHRSKLSAAGKGRTPWNKGISGVFKHSDEAKSKIAAGQIGRKRPQEVVERIAAKLRGRTLSEEHRAKLREKRKGKTPTLGMKFGEETRLKRREIAKRLGLKPPNMTGYKHSPEARKNMSVGQKRSGYMQNATGSRAPNWKGGISPKNRKVRDSTATRKWREAVLDRDSNTCQHCGKPGGKLQAHHIKEFATHPELRFDIDNGLTLCKRCHMTLHSLGKKPLVTLRTKGGRVIEVPSYKVERRIKQGCTLLTAQTPAT